uniref:Uncharacterized protein n=1 Tax=Anopheles albimanus TaxID=7167 RepID=A0A182FY33_ANOAL
MRVREKLYPGLSTGLTPVLATRSPRKWFSSEEENKIFERIEASWKSV